MKRKRKVASWIFSALVASVTTLASGCSAMSDRPDSGEDAKATAVDISLPLKQSQRCSGAAAVQLDTQANTLIIRLGPRPTPGYGVEVVRQQQMEEGRIELVFQESKPKPGMMMAQVMTSPCLTVSLPVSWSSLTVSELGSSQVSNFKN